ncbi:MAG TPA: M56 family metallopeptidase [Longimicrobium sp.]|jgi:beta-lactamase regulating signal transducer with metallopeptidase domain
MIVSWMLYSLLVSVLVAAAAWVLEEVCRLLGRPVRWVWIGAMGATLALVALAPLRTSAPTSLAIDTAVVRRTAPVAADDTDAGLLAALTDAATAVRDLAGDTLRDAATLGARIPGEALAAGWLVLTAALLAIAAATLHRGNRERRRWPLHDVAGTPVRVAPRVGPAVLGVRTPEVVVPRWLLEATPEEQRLVVLHEREHIRARDPLLLAAGCLAAALVPWNPAAWWMLRRLRTAVELDCDARVLRHGVRPAAYGTLLIDMAGRGPGLTLGAPALAGTPSSLERRIRAMNVRIPRFAPARAGLLGVLAMGALVAACETALPTTAEVDRMDVRAAETQATRFRVVGDDANMTYFVDGKQVTAEEARAVAAGRIAQIAVRRKNDGTGTFTITTGAPTFEGTAHTRDLTVFRNEAGGAQIRIRGNNPNRESFGPVHARTGENFEGLMVVDGRITDPSAMRTIAPGSIDNVEVIKGPAAARLYPNDPRAAHGVIRITTKAGARR